LAKKQGNEIEERDVEEGDDIESPEKERKNTEDQEKSLQGIIHEKDIFKSIKKISKYNEATPKLNSKCEKQTKSVTRCYDAVCLICFDKNTLEDSMLSFSNVSKHMKRFHRKLQSPSSPIYFSSIFTARRLRPQEKSRLTHPLKFIVQSHQNELDYETRHFRLAFVQIQIIFGTEYLYYFPAHHLVIASLDTHGGVGPPHFVRYLLQAKRAHKQTHPWLYGTHERTPFRKAVECLSLSVCRANYFLFKRVRGGNFQV